MNGNGKQSINFQRDGLILHGGPLSSTDPPSTMSRGLSSSERGRKSGKRIEGQKGKVERPSNGMQTDVDRGDGRRYCRTFRAGSWRTLDIVSNSSESD